MPGSSGPASAGIARLVVSSWFSTSRPTGLATWAEPFQTSRAMPASK